MSSKKHPLFKTHFSRVQISKLTNRHISNVVRWHGDGKLSVYKDGAGMYWTPKEEVLAFAAERQLLPPLDGAVAAMAFELFEEGLSAKDLVIKQKLAPLTASRLAETFAVMKKTERTLARQRGAERAAEAPPVEADRNEREELAAKRNAFAAEVQKNTRKVEQILAEDESGDPVDALERPTFLSPPTARVVVPSPPEKQIPKPPPARVVVPAPPENQVPKLPSAAPAPTLATPALEITGAPPNGYDPSGTPKPPDGGLDLDASFAYWLGEMSKGEEPPK
jgi:hypothetical protein